MERLIIEATTPEIIPEVPAQLLDKVCIHDAIMTGFPVMNVSMEVRKFGVDDNGVHVSSNVAYVVGTPNLDAEAETDIYAYNLREAATAYMAHKIQQLESQQT